MVHANADVTPYGRRRDLAVRERLESTFSTWWGNLVHPPGSVRTANGRTSRVFTPFFRIVGADSTGAVARAGRGDHRRRPRGRASRLRQRTVSARRRGGSHQPPGRIQPAGRRLRPGSRRSRPRRHLGTVGRPSLRDPGGPDDPGDHRRLDARSRRVHPPAGLAGLVRPPALGGAVAGRHGPAAGAGPVSTGRTTPTTSRHGNRAEPATRSSTPACASSPPPGGCTTGCA